MNFNVTKDTRGGANVPLVVATKLNVGEHDPMFPNGYKFPTAHLVNVVFNPKTVIKRKDEEVIQPTLSFIFTDAEKRQNIHTMYDLDPDNTPEDNTKEVDRYNQILKHIWDETIGVDKFPEQGLSPNAVDIATYFEETAQSFNTLTTDMKVAGSEDPKTYKTYAIEPVYYKVTVYKNKFGFPRYPNFLQKARRNGKNLPCIGLRIDPTHDKLVLVDMSANASGFGAGTGMSPGMPGMPSADGLPELV